MTLFCAAVDLTAGSTDVSIVASRTRSGRLFLSLRCLPSSLVLNTSLSDVVDFFSSFRPVLLQSSLCLRPRYLQVQRDGMHVTTLLREGRGPAAPLLPAPRSAGHGQLQVPGVDNDSVFQTRMFEEHSYR